MNKKLRRDQRALQPRPMRETDTDRQVVRLVYDYRLLSQNQLQRLLGKSRSRTQQILIRLYQHRYLERLFLPVWFEGRSPTLYLLDTRGVALLQGLGITEFSGQPSKKLSPLFLEHTLAINEVRIAIQQACSRHGWTLLTWQGENDLKADYDHVMVPLSATRSQRVPIVPDSYFIIQLPGQGVSHFFLELDRGTMTTERFKTKVKGYVAYYKSGRYTQRFQAQGFRMLTVVDTPSSTRMTNLLQQSATVTGIGKRFWFAHLPSLSSENILTQPIWQVAGVEEAKALLESSLLKTD